MARIIEVVYDNFDNAVLLLFKLDGDPIDFSAATRFVLMVGTVTVDTDISPGSITTTATTGELEFLLGDQDLPIGRTDVTLVVYDPAHTNGQILTCSEEQALTVDVKEC